MAIKHRQLLRFFSFKRIAIPIFIGLAVATWLLIRDFDKDQFSDIQWAKYPALWFALVLMLVALRALGYMYRIWLLTDGELNWRRSFQVIMLWEFASSITPSIVGGTAVALFIVRKEGISMGRTTAVVMTTALLDELFYIIMVPLVILLAGSSGIFITESSFVILGTQFSSFGVFIIGYVFILLLTSIILFGIFINPQGLKKFLIRIFNLRFLRRWQAEAAQTGDEIIVTSAEMRHKSIWYWTKAFLATAVTWWARFWVVNVLILAFTSVGDHFLIFARQLIMWVILLISPTPGSSGVAEFFFPIFFGEFIGPKLSTPLAILWRLISYYPYIFIGVIVLPQWIRRVFFGKRRSIRFRRH
ncbi:MAG: lysylphosphatidylglycerol synthase transmembrane domain-containing protein [Bacteroidales bacterium]|nr:lysylphosphatidylglycerol synthase transmembrane domain-containing protein [Bacteroidales bacterium]MDZ4205388.1 lysylphosphatidylglycerol synthase transmembrane domain-containing protein [Bacteroidales bacterium]